MKVKLDHLQGPWQLCHSSISDSSQSGKFPRDVKITSAEMGYFKPLGHLCHRLDATPLSSVREYPSVSRLLPWVQIPGELTGEGRYWALALIHKALSVCQACIHVVSPSLPAVAEPCDPNMEERWGAGLPPVAEVKGTRASELFHSFIHSFMIQSTNLLFLTKATTFWELAFINQIIHLLRHLLSTCDGLR
jgi:hypothetical protein